MLPSQRSFLLAASQLVRASDDQFETFVIKQYGVEGSWHQKLKPVLFKIHAKLGPLENRTIFIKEFLSTSNPQQLILLTKQLLKHKVTQQTHLLHYNLGILYTQSRDISRALFSYEMSLKLEPGFHPSVINYSNLLKEEGRGDEALHYIQKWITHYKPSYKIELQYLSLCQEKHLIQVHKMFRNRKVHPFVRYNLGVYLKRVGCEKEGEVMMQNLESIEIMEKLPRVDHSNQGPSIVSTHKDRQSRKPSQDSQSSDVMDNMNQQKLKDMIKRKRSLNNFYSNAHWLFQHRSEFQRTMPARLSKQSFLNKHNSPLSSRVGKRVKQSRVDTNPSNVMSKIKCIITDESTGQVSRLRPSNILRIKSRVHKSTGMTRRNHYDHDTQRRQGREGEKKQYQLSKGKEISQINVESVIQPQQGNKLGDDSERVEQPQIVREVQVDQSLKENVIDIRQWEEQKQQETGKEQIDQAEGEKEKYEQQRVDNKQLSSHRLEEESDANKDIPEPPSIPTQNIQVEEQLKQQPPENNCMDNNSALKDTTNLTNQSKQPKQIPALITSDTQKPKPLKKKVSYNQNLIFGKYGKAEDLQEQQQQLKKQIIDKLKQSKESISAHKALKQSSHSSNPNQNESSFSKSPDTSFTHNYRNSVVANKADARLREMLAKKQTSIKEFSSNSVSESGMYSDHNPPTKQRTSDRVKQKEIKDVVEEVIRIRQSLDIGEIPLDSHLDENISDMIFQYKEEYRKSTNHKEKLALLLKIGELFEKEKNYVAAARTYEKCIRSQSPEGFLRLGELQLNTNQIEAAIENLEKASNFFRTDVRLKLKLAYGYSLFSQGLQKAISITNSLLMNNPSNLQAVLLSSNIYQKQGQIGIALNIISAVDKELINESIKHYMGLLYLQDSNIEQAYDCFREALGINNKYIPSMIECATILSINKPKDAIRIFKRVLKSQPKNQAALGRLAKILQTQKQFSAAIQLYKSLLELIESYGIYESLGFCQMKMNYYPQAIQHFKKAITFESNVFCWKMIAECYQTMRQHDKALNYYQVALKMQPSATTYRKVSVCMIYLQDFKGAIRNLKYSLEIEETLEAYSLMANCHYLANQYDEAINFYKKAASIKGYDTGVYYNMAICYDKKEQFVKSKPLYQKILSQEPDNVKCLFNLANVLLISGRPSEALEYFERGLKNNPANQTRRFEIVELYEILNNLDKAEEHLNYCYGKNQKDTRVIESLLRISRKKKDIKKVNHWIKLLHDLNNPIPSDPTAQNPNPNATLPENEGKRLRRSSIENMT